MQRLSIIIPCLNEAGNIERLLTQLQPLRSRGHELILVDGGSRDNTRSLAKPLVDCMLQAPCGRASQMNLGVQSATGDVLWFLHADSLLGGDADKYLLQALANGKGWGRFDIRLSGTRAVFRVIEFMINWRSRITGIATGDQGIFIHHEIFQAVGGFADIPLMEDIELSRRLKSISRPICLHQRLQTSSRRWEERGILRTILLMWWLRLSFALGADPKNLLRQYR